MTDDHLAHEPVTVAFALPGLKCNCRRLSHADPGDSPGFLALQQLPSVLAGCPLQPPDAACAVLNVAGSSFT